MTKRIFALLLVLAMSLTLLAGCGSKSSADDQQGTVFSVDLSKFYEDMMAAAQESPFMSALEGEMLDNAYPGLSDIKTKQLVSYAPAISAVAMEFTFVEVTDSADVKAVQDILQARIDAQVDGGAWYPETIDTWANFSEIVTIDNYVCLFVCTDKDVLIEAFRAGGQDIPEWALAEGGEDDWYTEDEGDGEGNANVYIDENGNLVIEYPENDEVDINAPAAGGDGLLDDGFAVNPDSAVDDGFAVDSDGAADNGFAVTPGNTAEAPVYVPVPSEAPAAQPEVSAQPETTEISASVDLAAFFETLFADDPDNAPAVADLTDVPEMLDNYYPGLSDLELAQCHVFMPMITAVPFEIALIQVSSSADVDTVKAILQSRIDGQVENHHNYPMIIENWEMNSRIQVCGDYIMMVAYETCDSIVESFVALF